MSFLSSHLRVFRFWRINNEFKCHFSKTSVFSKVNGILNSLFVSSQNVKQISKSISSNFVGRIANSKSDERWINLWWCKLFGMLGSYRYRIVNKLIIRYLRTGYWRFGAFYDANVCCLSVVLLLGEDQVEVNRSWVILHRSLSTPAYAVACHEPPLSKPAHWK